MLMLKVQSFCESLTFINPFCLEYIYDIYVSELCLKLKSACFRKLAQKLFWTYNSIPFPVPKNSNARWGLTVMLTTLEVVCFLWRKEPEFSHFHSVVFGSMELMYEAHSERNSWYNGTCHKEQKEKKLRPHGQTPTKIAGVTLALINEWLPPLLSGGWWC